MKIYIYIFCMLIEIITACGFSIGEPIKLDDIVVSALRYDMSLDRLPLSTFVITSEQLERTSVENLSQLLDSTNLIQIKDYGPGSLSTVSIRGSFSPQVLVLVDGERINDSLSGDADIDKIPIYNVDRVEIIRGGGSALFGADAIGGIINIVTKSPKKPDLQVWSKAGSFHTFSSGMEISGKKEPVSALLSIAKDSSKSDFPFKDKSGRTLIRENADYRRRNVFSKLTWNISNSALIRLSASHSFSDSGSPGMIGMYTPEANKIDRANNVRLDVEHELTQETSYKLLLSKYYSAMRYVNPQYPYPEDDTHKVASTYGELQLHFHQSKGIVGYVFKNDEVSSTSVGDHDRRSHGLYTQYELSKQFTKNLIHIRNISIFPALRWDHYSDFGSNVNPKIGLSLSFENRLVIRSSMGTSYRAPTMNDLFWPSDPMTSGNPNLKPERSKDFDAGIIINTPNLKTYPLLPKAQLNVSYFRGKLIDGIKWIPNASGRWSPVNIAEIKSQGFESELTSKFFDVFTLKLNYVFLRSEDKLKRQTILQPKHSAGYSIQTKWKDLWLNLQGIYNSKRYYTVQNTKWLEPFFRNDLSVGTRKSIDGLVRLSLIFEVRNVFNTNYQTVPDYPLPGRSWNVKLSINRGGER